MAVLDTEKNHFGQALLDAYPTLLSVALARLGNRADADDLIQKTYERALEHRDSFVGGNLGGWLVTILRNLHTDDVRSAQHRLTQAFEDLGSEAAAGAGFGDGPNQENQIFLSEVIRVLGGLGGQCRELLVLYAQGYRVREIAETLSLPMGTVGRKMGDCRLALSDNLKNAGV